jgi:hypothetical protein
MAEKKKLAPESPKTKRAREKILKEWEKRDFLIKESNLADTIEKMHKWIAANKGNRVTLKKEIRLFDQNQNAVPSSKKVQDFAKSLHKF